MRLVAGGIAVAAVLAVGAYALPAKAALSATQVSAIVSLLQSFGADATTIARVQAALTGQNTGGSGSGGVCPVLTRSLSQGATGEDVRQLQRFLNANAATRVAVSGAGSAGLETTYFGPATHAAVVRFQAANGVSPIGVVGPATRAAVAAVCGGTQPSPSPSPSPSPRGSEGQLKSFSTIGADVENEVREGEDRVNVLGIEFDANDSDMTINRVDVEFEKVGGSGSNRLERYISSVSLWLDGKRLASQNVSRSNEDDDVYKFRFTGLNAVVEEGKEGRLYVAVDALNNIDSTDQDTQWSVSIPSSGIRATDTLGISDTYAGQDLSENFSFGEQTVGTLRLSAGRDNPDDDIVTVDEDRRTDDVLLVEFELRARNQDIEIEDLPVSLGIGGNAAHVGEIVRSVTLMRGNREIKTKSVPSNAGTYEVITFDNINLTIDEGDTETFRVIADIQERRGEFHEGDTLTASTTASLSGWDVEDARGESVDPTGSVTGGTLSFFTTGMQARVLSTSAVRTNGTVAGGADSVDFIIRFSVTALGDEDIYIDGDVVQGVLNPTTATAGLSWATTTDSSTGFGEYTAILTPDNGYRSSDTNVAGDKRLLVESGQTRNFTFRVTVPAHDDNVSVGVRLTGIKWDTDNVDDMDNLYNFNLSPFTTDTITGLYVR